MNNIEEIKKELKRLASIKCRLNKQRGKKTYEEEMSKVLLKEAQLKELRNSIVEPKRTTTTLSQDDINEMQYEDILKAIKSIQSKKSNTKWLTPIEGDNDEYRNACRIEAMLNNRRAELQPTAQSMKSKLLEVLDSADALSKEELIASIKDILG